MRYNVPEPVDQLRESGLTEHHNHSAGQLGRSGVTSLWTQSINRGNRLFQGNITILQVNEGGSDPTAKQILRVLGEEKSGHRIDRLCPAVQIEVQFSGLYVLAISFPGFRKSILALFFYQQSQIDIVVLSVAFV